MNLPDKDRAVLHMLLLILACVALGYFLGWYMFYLFTR
jgi:hypothetical protein